MSERALIEDQTFARRVDWRVWRRVFAHALPYRRELATMLLAAIGAAIGDVVPPLVTRSAVDRVVKQGAGAELLPHALAYAACVLCLSASVFTFVRLGGRLSSLMAHDIRRSAFDRLQELSFSYFDQRPVGWLMARMTSDCDRLARVLTWGAFDFVWAGMVLLTTSVVMLSLAPRLALAALAVSPLVLWLSAWFQRRILASARRVRKTNARLTAAFSEALLGARTTKALTREEGAYGDFRSLAGDMQAASMQNALQNAVYLPLVLTLLSLGTAMALVAGGVSLSVGNVSLGTLLAFLTWSALLFNPVADIARNFAELQMAQASAERVIGLIDTEPEIADSPEVAAAVARGEAGPADVGRIELRGVSFSYGEGARVLDDIDLVAEPGETVALVGPTGGGKTTLVGILCRFYEPTSGEVLMAGVDYRGLGLAWLRSRLAVVLQTPHLFTGTIRENIRYGRLDASDAEVEEAAREVDAHGFIAALEQGYGTEVGEGGARLSTGQKQLVSFARAVLARPRILVMDEATSSIDTETEQRIQRALPRVLDGPTSFVIAHRLSTIRNADRIVFVDHGRIVESGTHAELLKHRGRYYELYTRQRIDDAIAHPGAGGEAGEAAETGARAPGGASVAEPLAG